MALFRISRQVFQNDQFVLLIQDSAEDHFPTGGGGDERLFPYWADFLRLRQFSEQEAKVSKWVKILEEKADCGDHHCRFLHLT